ncbi:TIR domain-containing adapter molecule 1 [Gouania willdenowi]|uniref:TIR domain-containing adapter molecule 1 n=1 Tax=Gouania willdenowi TaxID=441366 RepID=UPI001056DBB6|nr:TIR domain-containing adapter molecule 1-like [Gouania willdenowi]
MMSHSECEGGGPGTALRDVLDVLSQAPRDRLLSLTLMLVQTPEDRLVQVLTLLVLHRDQQAMDQLLLLRDTNPIANRLLDTTSTLSPGGLGERCAGFQDVSSESLRALARVFKVLSEHDLCGHQVRDAAYRRALSSVDQGPHYCAFMEEAKYVCGPELTEWTTSWSQLRCEPEPGSPGSGTLIVTRSGPCEAITSPPSYPSQLEISVPFTSSIKQEKPGGGGLPDMTTPLEPPGPTKENLLLPKETQEEEEVEEEEEVFYAFVIFHAREDSDTALRLKEKVETIIKCEGATFSEDFCVPGKHTLACVEDAVNNSAFSFLLLTRHFNTSRLLEVKTNMALMNSINKQHKFNTVIPLLPRRNALEPQNLPLVLSSLVPLEENKNFDKKVLKLMSPATIRRQRITWTKERRSSTPHNILRLSLEDTARGGARGGASQWPHQSNICIQNANYVMIGNDSQMTVRGAGGDGAE